MNQGIEGGIVVGSIVSFTIELDKNGRPQAREARLEADKENEDDQGWAGLRIGDALGKVFKGTVKSFNVSRGFGFLTAPELQRLFPGKDVYVAQTQVPDNRPLTSGRCAQTHRMLTRFRRCGRRGLRWNLLYTSPSRGSHRPRI
eukprot:g17710.t1